MNLNSIAISGRVGKEPEHKHTTSGTEICTFSVAVNGYKDSVSWFNVAAFGKTAEICKSYLNKGMKVIVTGSMEQKKWKDREGNEKSAWVLNANSVIIDEPKNKETKDNYEDDIPLW